MKTYVLTTLFCLLNCIVFAQSFEDFGVYVKGNFSTQHVRNPQRPDDGVFEWDYIKTWGMGIYGVRSIDHDFAIRNRLAYTQKGFNDTFQMQDASGQLQFLSSRNVLHYLSIDGLLQYTMNEGVIRPYALLGMSASALIAKEIPTLISNPQGVEVIDPEDFNRFGLSGIFNVGMKLDEVWFVEGEMNFDMLPALKQPDASIKNWVWSLALGLNLSELKMGRH